MRNTLAVLAGLAALTAAAHADSHTISIFPGETMLIGNGAQTELWASVEDGDVWNGIGLLVQPTGTLDVTVELNNPTYNVNPPFSVWPRWSESSHMIADPEAKVVAIGGSDGLGLGNQYEDMIAGAVDPETGAILIGTITVNGGYGDLYFGVGTLGIGRTGCDSPTQDIVIFGDADPLPCNKFEELANAPIANAPMLEVLLMPEPASLALLTLAGLFGVRRR